MSDAKPLTDEEIKARRQWVKDWPDSEARKLFEATYSEEQADRHMVIEARYLATLAERDERIKQMIIDHDFLRAEMKIMTEALLAHEIATMREGESNA